MQPPRITRREMLKWLGMSSTALALAACAPPAAQPAAPAAKEAQPSAAKAVTELTFWSRFEFLKPATDLFNEGPGAEKGIHVTFSTVPYDQFVEKLTTAVTTNTAPDVCSIDLIQCPYFNSIGAFADLTTEYNALPYKDELSKGMLPLGAYEGKQYQLPFSSDNSAFFYNKAIFKEAGLDPEKGPITWMELISVWGCCSFCPSIGQCPLLSRSLLTFDSTRRNFFPILSRLAVIPPCGVNARIFLSGILTA